jgi:hypothetical protein
MKIPSRITHHGNKGNVYVWTVLTGTREDHITPLSAAVVLAANR